MTQAERSPLPTTIGPQYLADMAVRFPMALYSISAKHDDRPALSRIQWLADLQSREPEGVEAELRKQLGGNWTGLKALTPLRRTVLTVLAAHAARYDVSGFLKEANRIATDPDCNPERIEMLLTPALTRAAMSMVDVAGMSHAFELTVALALLHRAKHVNGVFPSSAFLWVRAFDRPLWLILNGYGRRDSFIEVAGVFAHYQAENYMGTALPEPKFTRLSAILAS